MTLINDSSVPSRDSYDAEGLSRREERFVPAFISWTLVSANHLLEPRRR